MIDVNTASNAELDQLAQNHDANQGQRILDQVYNFLGRFVSYPNDAARIAHAAWIVHAHAMHLWDSTPRIAFLSPEPGSGKSRALEVTDVLVPRPLQVMNVSANFLFREVASEDGMPTVLFDEADTVFGPKAREHEDLRGWLNAGHRKGAMAGRCVIRGKEVKTEKLPAYCAVALAGLGNLPDTVMTRSVIIRMRKRHAGEAVEAFRERIHSKQAIPIKMAIEVWTKSIPQIEPYPELPEQIQDRDADVWEPLIFIGDTAGGDWSARIRHAAVTLVAASKEREESLGVRLLADIRHIFGHEDKLQTNAILTKLVALEESPWGDMRGKPLDARRLSKLLKEYDVKPRQLWFGSEQLRGFAASDFKDAWQRYLPLQSERHVTTVTPVTDTLSEPVVTDVTHVTCPPHCRETHRCRQCGGNGLDVMECAISGETVRLHRGCIDLWTASHPRPSDD
jgi:Protein of unknown function (DUF3631)